MIPQAEAQAQTIIAPERMTFEEYLKRYDSFEGGRTEWLGGEVAIYPMSNNVEHQQLLKFLALLFELYLSARSLGTVLLAGVPMKVGDTQPAREPDLMILLNAHLDRLQPTYVEGTADVVIEIVSPKSDARDHGDRFIEYEAAGVPEYWLLDPLRQLTNVYVLGEDGRYRPLPPDAQGRMTSTLLPGFALDPALLWRDPLPTGVEIVALAQAMGS